MNKRFECKDFAITCLTPVHIGNGIKLKKSDYWYNRNRGEVYLVDQAKLNQLLVKKKLMNQFLKDLSSGRFDLGYWLRQNNISLTDQQFITKQTIPYYINGEGKNKDRLNDIDLQIKQVDGRLYIPGSSLKGALRTAILSKLLQDNPAKQRHWWQKLKQEMERASRPNEYKNLLPHFEEDLLAKLDIPNATAAVNDVMRGLVVGDAISSATKTIIIDKLDSSYKGGKVTTPHQVALFRECIPAGTKFVSRISMDKTIMQKIGINSLTEILTATRQFYQDGLNMQRAVFGRTYAAAFDMASTADLILGGGTGFLTKTVYYTLALADSDIVGTKLLAKFFDKMYQTKNKRTRQRVPAHNHVRDDSKIAPRTLKVVPAKNGYECLGLCQIRELKHATTT